MLTILHILLSGLVFSGFANIDQSTEIITITHGNLKDVRMQPFCFLRQGISGETGKTLEEMGRNYYMPGVFLWISTQTDTYRFEAHHAAKFVNSGYDTCQEAKDALATEPRLVARLLGQVLLESLESIKQGDIHFNEKFCYEKILRAVVHRRPNYVNRIESFVYSHRAVQCP